MGGINNYNYYCDGCGDFKQKEVRLDLVDLNTLALDDKLYCPECLFPLEKSKKSPKKKTRAVKRESLEFLSIDNSGK